MPVSQSGEHLPYAGTPEMDALVANINQNPQAMQVVATDPQLLAEVIKHVSGADVDANDLIQAVSTWPDEAAEASMGESEDATAADEVVDEEADVEEVASAPPSPDEDEEGYDEFTKPPEGGVPSDDEDGEVQQAAMPASGSNPMPRSGANNPIDDLISAQMMQRAVGNPNAPVPSGAQVGRQMRPAIPQSRMPSSSNPQQQMIAKIFRNQGKSATKKKASKNA